LFAVAEIENQVDLVVREINSSICTDPTEQTIGRIHSLISEARSLLQIIASAVDFNTGTNSEELQICSKFLKMQSRLTIAMGRAAAHVSRHIREASAQSRSQRMLAKEM
jgi:hypothetical protein